MPIYEYECRACGDAFELLVRGSEAPGCPSCASADLERVFSLTAMSSHDTRRRNLAHAKRRNEGVRKEQIAADHDAMRHYYEEH